MQPATGSATNCVHVFGKPFARLAPVECATLYFERPIETSRELIRLALLLGSAALSSLRVRMFGSRHRSCSIEHED